MSRQLQTTTQSTRTQIDRSIKDKTRRAFLVTPYRDKFTSVIVQFSDPRTGSRGLTTRATVAPGIWGLDTVAPDVAAGSPVTVVIRRGRVQVVGF